MPARDPALPFAFGPKCDWMAVRSTSPPAVAVALGLRGPEEVAWEAGVDAAYGDGHGMVFVTPVVDGWVLALGSVGRLAMRERVERLSREFGETQGFSTHRGASAGTWVLARGGHVVRSAEFADGELLHSEGELTSVERELGMRSEEAEATRAASDEPPILDEDEVLRVAGAWSVDPSTLDRRQEPRAFGLLGQLGK
jgi:hypothetical protein